VEGLTMYQETTFISRKKAEAIDEIDNSILISISTPLSQEWAWYRAPIIKEGVWKEVLSVKFHDVDPSGQSGLKMKDMIEYTLFDTEQAIRIFEFLKKHQDDCTRVIVHCDAGISRSAAVSKFISIIYGLYFPENYSVYNRHIFSTLMQEYGKSFYGEGLLPAESLPGNLNFGEANEPRSN
jgi:rhodanese-related sulfurtransferase